MTISETTDRVQEIGREFLKPFPKGWRETVWNNGNGWTCTAVDQTKWTRTKWPHRQDFEAKKQGSTPDEARRLCREEAERKAAQ